MAKREFSVLYADADGHFISKYFSPQGASRKTELENMGFTAGRGFHVRHHSTPAHYSYEHLRSDNIESTSFNDDVVAKVEAIDATKPDILIVDPWSFVKPVIDLVGHTPFYKFVELLGAINREDDRRVYGFTGADTELDHWVDTFQRNGIYTMRKPRVSLSSMTEHDPLEDLVKTILADVGAIAR